MIREYYRLAKPGIVYGNLLPAVAAFLFGASGMPQLLPFTLMCAGLSLVIASGCVVNNILDRAYDARMERTKRRAIPRGAISVRAGWGYALVLGLLGTLLLAAVDWYALAIALAGWLVYVALYTPLKPRHPSALFVGAIAGATPPVVGYAAAAHALDVYALILFAALYLWQLPHFIAIAYFRYEEYTAAGIPLIIKNTPTAAARANARRLFVYSLWVLLFGCGALIVHTWIR